MVTLLETLTSIVPGGDFADKVIQNWKERKIREAQEIFLMEIRDGVFDNIDVDDRISISYRLWRAISEGTAKSNLRLLCRLVQGLSDKKMLTISTFSKFASIIESLTEDEIKIIAKDIWLYNNPMPKNIDKTIFSNNEDYEKELVKYNKLKKEWQHSFSSFLQEIGAPNLLPYVYFTEEYYSLLRTGLYGLDIDVYSKGSLNPIYNDYGSDETNVDINAETEMKVYFTSLFIELQKYVNFLISYPVS